MTREIVRQYAVATGITLGLGISLALYLTVRRGYFDLAIVNKSVASGSLLLLGIVLLLGPLCRYYQRFDSLGTYRKELGILAFFLGTAHVYLSMFPLARHGPLGLYTARPLVAYSGLLGLVLMTGLFAISLEKIKKNINVATWWKMQYRGVRLAALAVLFHMVVFKYAEWGKWLNGETGNIAVPSLPPASMIVALFSAFVLIVRLSELTGDRIAKVTIPTSFFLTVLTFGWLLLR